MKTKILKNKLDIITIGGIVRDINFLIEQGKILRGDFKQEMLAFDLGAKINIKSVYFGSGGGGGNVAVGLSRFGLKTAIVGRVGNDHEGDKIKEHFRIDGIETKFIQIDKKESTGFSFLCTHPLRKKYVAFLYRGASEKLVLEKNIEQIKTSWLYLASLTNKNWLKILKKVKEIVIKKKIKWAWNPGNLQIKAGYKVLKPYLGVLEVLILNESEAKMLVGDNNRPLIKKRSLSELLIMLASWGPRIVAITVGAKGAYVYDSSQKKIYYSQAINIKPIDTTGAGDAFSSGFISGLIIFKDIEKALKLGILNSGSVVKKIGAQNGLLSKSDLRKI